MGATTNGQHAAQRGDRNGSGKNTASANGTLSNGADTAHGSHLEGIHTKSLSPAPRRVFEVVVVGYGNWGSKHVRVFSSMPEVKVTVVDQDPLRLAEAGREHPGVKLDESLDRVLDSADVVVVATPPRSHAPIAHAAIQANCHVLIEKPLATSVAACEELIDAALLQGVHLMVGHTFEHDAAIWKLREIAHSGELGEIRYIDCARLNLGLYQDDVNVIWDLAPHDISIVNFILGELPTGVSAWGQDHAGRGFEDVAHMKLRYADRGIYAYIHVSWLDPCKVRRVTIVGSEKMAVYNDMAPEGKIRIYDVGIDQESQYPEPVKYRRGDVYAPSFEVHEPLAEQARQVIHSVRTGHAPRTNGESGLAVARVLEASDRALRSGTEVLLDEPVIDITLESVPPIVEAPPPWAYSDRQATA